MYFTLKNYQVLKLKNYFKSKSLFIVLHCAKLNLKDWIYIEQKLKELKVSYYKPLNKIVLKELKNSVYINYSFVINGFFLFISFDNSKKMFDIVNKLNLLFVIICFKLTNKLYSPKQLNKFQFLFFKENVIKFYKILHKSIKSSYILI